MVWEQHNWGAGASWKLQPQCCRGFQECLNSAICTCSECRPRSTPGCCLHSAPQNWPLPQQLPQHCGLRKGERMGQNPALPWLYPYVCFKNCNSGINTEIQSVQSILIQPKYNKIDVSGNHCFTSRFALHSHNVSAYCWYFWVLYQIFSCDVFYNKLLMFIFSCHLLLAFWEPPVLVLVNLLSKNSYTFKIKYISIKKSNQSTVGTAHLNLLPRWRSFSPYKFRKRSNWELFLTKIPSL